MLGRVRRLKFPPTHKLVLLALADAANDHGEASPTMTDLKEISGICERSIQGAIIAFEAIGLVKVER